MNRVTFEMLAKWIAKESGAKVLFDNQKTGACANVKTNEISMPCDLKEQNILAALALLMHEGAHLKHSKVIPPDVVKGCISRNILNVMEDIRIDNKNFRVLNNIKDFYDRLMSDHVYNRKNEIKKEPLMTRCLINSIMRLEGFNEIDDKEALEFSSQNGINETIWQGVSAIENHNWPVLKEKVKEIKKIFKVKDEDDVEIPELKIGIGGAIEGDENEGQIPGELKAKMDIGNTGKYMRPSSAWDKGEGIKGPSRDIVGEAAFQDLTKQSFKELLNLKEKRMVNEGMKLNTDNITDFFTGNIDDLFHEQDIVKVKKSKIAFCLDSSGSMSTGLLDHKQRTDVLVRCVRSMINILKELQATEGLNISYDVWAFDYNAEKLNPDRWEKEYSARGGGTNLLNSFLDVQNDMLNNQEIDGNRMVILMTDGEVGADEITDLRSHIIKHGAEVRCMVMGVGAQIGGHFVKTIAGENNILMDEHADSVVMDCIRTMIE